MVAACLSIRTCCPTCSPPRRSRRSGTSSPGAAAGRLPSRRRSARGHHPGGRPLRPSGPGGGGFPTGRKWARSRRRPRDGAGDRYVVGQRRRGRAGHVQGPGHHACQPVPGGRGPGDRRAGGRRPRAYVAVKASFRREIEALDAAIVEMADAGSSATAHHARRRARGVPLRRGEGAARGDRGRRAAAPAVPAVHPGPVRPHPEIGWSAAPGAGAPPTKFDAANPTLVNNVETLANVPHILGAAPSGTARSGTAESPGRVVHRRRRRRPARRGRGRAGHPLRDGHRPGRRRRGGGPLGEGGAVGRRQPGGHRRSARHAGQLRGLQRRGQRDGRVPASSSTTTPPAWSRSPACCPGSSTSSRAGSARPASSAPARSPPSSARCSTGRRTSTRSR